jgi:hypothetical protein
MRRFLIAFLLVIISSVFVFAQTTGRLSGVVADTTGKVVPGATVTAKDNSTGKESTATSNEEGFFQFPQLEFGTYTVTVTSTGFKTYVANAVKIDVGRDYTLNPPLEVGNISENVTVTAGADVVTADTAQVSNTVSPQQILSLPLLTRNPLALTGLQAGVSANSAQLTTINGMRTTFTNITRDGLNIQDTFIRANATDFAPGRPSVDDTGEFTITTSNQEADQGYGGAQIRLVTPRGTKDFHGALFAYNRNSDFAANSFFNNRTGAVRPFRNRNQYGGKVSGPLWVPGFGEGTPTLFKDKGFFFFAYEGIKDPVTAAATRTILSPSARAGTFTYTRANLGAAINTNVNGATVNCPARVAATDPAVNCTITNFLAFAQGTFPAGNVQGTTPPQILAYLAGMPSASNFTGGDGLNTQGFRFNRASNQERNQYAARVDVDIDEGNALTFVYNFNREENLRPDVDTSGFDVTPDVLQFSDNTQFTMAYRRVFSPNFVNDFRGGVFTSVVPFDRISTPDQIFAGFITTSPLAFLDQGRNTKAYNLQSNADWILGDHTLRFGGQGQFFKVNSYNDASILPQLNFGAGTATTFQTTTFAPYGGINTTQAGTANGLLALLGGQYTSVQQFFNVASIAEGFKAGATSNRPFRYENHALYVADRWKAMNNLTLSFGVRYELFPALRLNNGNALEPVITDLDNPIASLLNPAGIYNPIGGNAGRRNAYYKTDYNNFAPNLGISYAPSFEGGFLGFLFGNKSVLRAGYSHIYGNDSIVTSINNAAVGNAGLATTGLITAAGNHRLNVTPTPTINPPTLGTFPRTYLQNNANPTGNFFGTVFAVDPKLQTPKVEQYIVGFQREFFGNMAFEIRYVGSRSDNLGRGVDLGQMDIVNNGFLADFLRAQNNVRVGGNAFCVVAGCVPLTIFQNGGVGGPGRIPIGGATGLNAATFTTHINNGTPADLALAIINSTAPLNVNNQPCAGPANCNPNAVPFVKFVPNPSTGVIDLFLNDGMYNYNSLQMEVRRRFSNGLYFQANYTLAKNLTNAVGTSQQLFEPYLDNANKQWDYQRADYDQKHTFNFNAIYQLPFGKGKMFLNNGGIIDKVFGGWELSGLGQWTSGAPISFVDTRGTYNRTARSARQTPTSSLTNAEIQALAGVFEANGAIYWINPSIINTPANGGQASTGYNINGTGAFAGQVFFNNQPGQTGNIGRTIIDGPGYFNVNMALLKNIRFTETMRLQLRAEGFNVFNTVNFFQNTQFANINSNTFGQITGAFGPREMQFAARFEF